MGLKGVIDLQRCPPPLEVFYDRVKWRKDMSKQELVQRTVRAGAMASHFPFREILDLHAHQSLIERLGKVGFGKMVSFFIPEWLPGDLKGLRRMTAGGEQVAYTDGQNVLKIVFSSISPDAEEVDSAVHEYQTQFDTASSFMGNHLAKTTYSRLSLYGWYALGALQAHQKPSVSFENVEALVAYDKALPYRRQLGSLATSVEELFEDTALYPDLNGCYNVVLTGKGLTVVDNIMVTPTMQQVLDPRVGRPIGEIMASKLSYIQNAAIVPRITYGSRQPELR